MSDDRDREHIEHYIDADPVAPNPKDCQVEEAGFEFMMQHAAEVNFLIASCLATADMGDVEFFAASLAILASYHFNLGVKYAAEKS